MTSHQALTDTVSEARTRPEEWVGVGGLMNVTMSVMGGPTKTARYFITKSMIRINTISNDDLKHSSIM